MRGDYNLPQTGLCVKLSEDEKEDFFDDESEEAQTRARTLCGICPMKQDCLRVALDNEEEYGIWGGADPHIRRLALSVDMNNKAYTRAPFPACPNCYADTEELSGRKRKLEGGGRWPFEYVVDCNKCGFDWTSRTSFRGVQTYWKYRKSEYEQAEREAAARARFGYERDDVPQIPQHGIDTLNT